MTPSEAARDAFRPGGPVASTFPQGSYAPRPGQVRMASLVADTISSSGPAVSVIEAGTGTGKTYGYLVPAIQDLMKEEVEDDERAALPRRFVVATANVNLLRQIAEKDAPRLLRALGAKGRVRTAVVMGRARYLCLREVAESLRDEKRALGVTPGQDELFEADAKTKRKAAEIEAFRKQAFAEDSRGLSDDIHPWPDWLGKEEVGSRRSSCAASACPFRERCPYRRAMAAAREAQLVLTNHSIVLLDAKNRLEEGVGFDVDCLLPQYSVLIVDECHALEDYALGHFSDSWSAEEIEDIYTNLARKTFNPDPEKGGERTTLLELVASRSKLPGASDKAKDFALSLSNLVTSARDFDRRADAGALADFDRTGSDMGPDLLARDFLAEGRPNPDFPAMCSSVLTQAEMVHEEWANLFSSLDTDSLGPESAGEASLIELAAHNADRILCAVKALSDYLSSLDDPDTWSGRHFHGRMVKRPPKRGQSLSTWDFVFTSAPLWADVPLRDAVFNKIPSAILTSATIAAEGSFASFRRSVGMDARWFRRAVAEEVEQSPFDYRSNTRLIYPGPGTSAPLYDHEKRGAYSSFLADTIAETADASDGGVLVLFHAASMMRLTAGKVEGRLGGRRLLVQSPSLDRKKLGDEMRKDPHAVLFGLRSFWEGFDVPGPNLRVVIVTQLPYAYARAPRTLSLKEAIGPKAFMDEVDRPAMLKQLTQGCGRLVRSVSDKGCVLVCDRRFAAPRPGGKSVMKLFGASAPPYSPLPVTGDFASGAARAVSGAFAAWGASEETK